MNEVDEVIIQRMRELTEGFARIHGLTLAEAAELIVANIQGASPPVRRYEPA